MPTSDLVDEPRAAAFARPPLTCVRVRAADGAVRLKLAGELDVVTADLARDAVRIAQAESRSLICDLRDVAFVDLSGLRVLVDAAEHATLTGRRLRIDNCPPIVPRMLKLLGLEDALRIRVPRRAPARGCVQGRPRVV